MIEQLIGNGHIVDIMCAFIAVEVVAIALYRQRFGGGIALWPLLVNIGAGGSLMLALRAALTDAAWPIIAAFLLSSLAFHVSDVVLRWQPADDSAA